MAKIRLIEIGMDPMERLFYERQGRRQKAYAARLRKNRDKGQRVSAARKPVNATNAAAFGQVSLGSI